MAIRGRRFPSEVRANFKGEEHRKDWMALHKIGVPTIMHFLEFRSKYGQDGISAVNAHGENARVAIENMEKEAKMGFATAKLINEHGPDIIRVATRYGSDAVKAVNRHGARVLTAIEEARGNGKSVREELKALLRRPPQL